MENDKNMPVNIVVGETGISVDKNAASLGGIKGLTGTGQPPTSLPDVPTLAESKIQLRQLTEKALLCAMEKLNTLLATVNPTAAELAQYMDLTLKLLDAKEAFEWADAFRAAILKNPKLMAPNGRGLMGKSLQTRTNATIAQRLDRGDTRTTPKRLLASMPQDDEQEKATG